MSRSAGSFPTGGPARTSQAAGGGLEPTATTADVAAHLGVTEAWVRKRREKGTLPFPAYKVGHFVRFFLSEVQEWLLRQRHYNTAEAQELAD